MRLLKYSAVLTALFLAGAGAANAGDAVKGDAVKGKATFQLCRSCHIAEKGGGNGAGPNLFGIVGRKAASLRDFTYSGALKKSGIVWTNDKLALWIKAPDEMVPGTFMTFPGLEDPAMVNDVVAYLDTLK